MAIKLKNGEAVERLERIASESLNWPDGLVNHRDVAAIEKGIAALNACAQVLQSLDVGGEQGRAFASEIAKLRRVVTR